MALERPESVDKLMETTNHVIKGKVVDCKKALPKAVMERSARASRSAYPPVSGPYSSFDPYAQRPAYDYRDYPRIASTETPS